MSTVLSTSDRAPSRLEAAFYKLFTRQGQVVEVEAIGEAFRRITLEGEALRDVAWVPGEKLQVALGGWTLRTYTPMSWDPRRGRTQFLAHLNASHPAAQWARGLAIGTTCTYLGPRASLDLEALARPPERGGGGRDTGLLFGDETSIGLAAALRHTQAGSAGVTVVLEVGDVVAVQAVLDALDIADATLVHRAPDDGHLATIEAMLDARLADRSLTHAVLSGKSTSIARLYKRLKRALGRRQVATRAYWAPGKTGLD